jgi:hypothetical protein
MTKPFVTAAFWQFDFVISFVAASPNGTVSGRSITAKLLVISVI